jgi:hypothetical protein
VAASPRAAGGRLASRCWWPPRLARGRLAADAASGDPAILAAGAVRIRFGACRAQIAALWTVLEAGRGLLDASTGAALILRVREQIARAVLRVRRPRSCERKVRQPVKKWPRMFTPSSITSPACYDVCAIA